MDKTVFEIGKKFSKSVKEKLKPSKVVLYGSYSCNEQTKDSDIDIAVIFNGFQGNEWKTASNLCLTAWKIDNRIEPVLLDTENDPSGFCEHVMKTGIEL